MILDDDKHIKDSTISDAPITPELLNHLGWYTKDPEYGFIFEHVYFNAQFLPLTHIKHVLGVNETFYIIYHDSKGKIQGRTIKTYKDYQEATNEIIDIINN